MIARPFPGLAARQWIGSALHDVPRLPEEAMVTHLGRTALAQAYRALRIGPGDEVLIPALHCGVEVDAARYVGATTRFYRVRRTLDLDPDDVAARIGDATRAVVVIHAFGRVQDLGAVAALCRAKGIALIEDCAHLLPIVRPAGPGELQPAGAPGSAGQAAVYSLTKFFPVPDGGLLFLRDGWPDEVRRPRLNPPPPIPLARRTVRLLLDRLGERRQGAAALIEGLLAPLRRGAWRQDLPAYDPGSSRFEPAVVEAGASPVTCRVLHRIDLDAVARTRHRNYDVLARSLKGLGGVELVDIGPQAATAPMVLPVRIERRALVEARLTGLGVGTYRFGAQPSPELPRSEFPEAEELRETILGIPVHQQLSDAHLDAIAMAVKRSVA